ncbi:death-associated inhibitor of apoptosis 2-like [Cydia strobilella]|uniref:death-associated inhibitor of apoptosis 2-like n=1 Tax=Cydia strobilella TaxID=1100964 RepID=UPI003005F3AE
MRRRWVCCAFCETEFIGAWDWDLHPLFIHIRRCLGKTNGAHVDRSTPIYPNYSTEDARLSTFFDIWPKAIKPSYQPKTLLARRDVPWEQHALWFSNCYYLLLVKGLQYIQRIINEACMKDETSAAAVQQRQQSPPSLSSALAAYNESHHGFCKVCMEDELNVCLVPCGHIVTCAKCSMVISKCVVCRSKIDKRVRIYY